MLLYFFLQIKEIFMKSLVIAEKPSVGRDIARVLGCTQKNQGCLEGKNYVVCWALGHLVTLADPEEYDKKYKEWSLELLPMMPAPFQLTVIPKTAHQYRIVKSQLFRKDIKDIIIATDAGREGELVARLILNKAACRKPIRRLWISSVTDKAIQEGFSSLQDGRKYNSLYFAALSRAKADWLVGINATRALTCKYNAQLSCGRVQTPTLAMIAQRSEEIRNFTSEEYYGIQLHAGTIKWSWQDERTGSQRSFYKDKIEKIVAQLEGKSLEILEIKQSLQKKPAPPLYDLTELQSDANKKYGFSAKETLNLMQSLYEHHKVLTYPRTDSRYLTADIVETLPERLKACGTEPYRSLAGPLSRMKFSKKASFVNDKKVSDHHAIIPTEEFVRLDLMSNNERKIYDLVVRRFLAVMMPPFEYKKTALKANCAGFTFTAQRQEIISSGWKAAYSEEEALDDDYTDEDSFKDNQNQKIPSFDKGQKLKTDHIHICTGKTKAPAYFTEASLLKAMENPVHYLTEKNSSVAKTLGESGGLGTVATRADIIDKLFNSFLIEKKGKDIHITSKGKQLLSLVPADLKKPELTADWELKLTKIAKGQLKSQDFMDEISSYTQQLLLEIKNSQGSYRHDNLTNTPCPVCGKKMLSVKGKNSQMLVCQDRACGHRETISRTSNARCPKCHKKMQLYVKGKEDTFICSCGYKEKLSAFKNRRQKEGAGVSKRDVQRYMKQQKEEAVNNPFASALANIKLDR